MCFISISLNLIRCLSRYRGTRKEATLLQGVGESFLQYFQDWSYIYSRELAACSICSARFFTHIIYVEKKKSVFQVTNFKQLKLAPQS